MQDSAYYAVLMHQNILNSKFRVSVSSKHGSDLLITLDSRSGTKDSPGERNPDYIPRLGQILSALKTMQCTVIRIEVVSNNKKLSPKERVLALRFPIEMKDVRSVDALRREIQAAQRRVGRDPLKTGGNNTKKIGIWVKASKATAAAGIRSHIP